MKVILLRQNDAIYSGNVYLVLGCWNRIEDVNTLIDVGTDGSITREIDSISTGFGKRAVEQVVLTHTHFDHAGGLPVIRKLYAPVVRAHPLAEGVDSLLRDRQIIRIGDRDFQVLLTPGHSADSICLYCEEDRVLFSGDTPIRIMTPGGSYIKPFVEALKRLSNLRIDVIYPGHGPPVSEHVREILLESIKNVRKSVITNECAEESMADRRSRGGNG